eukprot:TRINITY_DN255_c0_g1_i1.p1 TRINITY_DN255_c0_g1~~TRINITY_DN255_c0_g1_i1.p1  ORF type:complete len:146 (+),score=32.42 TRINITY_DN255_c0_g1_i1:300-737(+)
MQGAVRSALAGARGAILRHVAVRDVSATSAATVPMSACAAVVISPTLSLRRFFGGENAPKGTYLGKEEVTDRVLSVVRKFDKANKSKISPDAHFISDLGLDSLDTVEVVMAFEEEFGFEIPDKEADKLLSCRDAIEYIASNPYAK